MQVLLNPDRLEWPLILQRPYVDNSRVLHSVQEILETVKEKGDAALKELTYRFDGIALDNLQVPITEMESAGAALSDDLKSAIVQAINNIETFHAPQLSQPEALYTMPGVRCWRRSVGIDKIGLYIPGGTAPLFSTVLMLAIPARIAGCKEIILCTPCGKDGKVHPAVLFAAKQTGITQVFKIGGAQAIAAMAFGTDSVPAVYKIFGPGNQYVTAAKQLVQMQGIAIDMPAGPSEVCVLADATARPEFVAADLLSQAEHGPDSQVLLVATDQEMVNQVQAQLALQLNKLPRKEFAKQALDNSRAVVVPDMATAVAMVNDYAAEHLIISCANAAAIGNEITNAGSVFLGNYSPESAGDYASGTNHTLPTNAFARAYSGVSVDSFVKKITYQELTEEGLQNIGDTVIAMAEAEGLEAHAAAVRIRVQQLHNAGSKS